MRTLVQKPTNDWQPRSGRPSAIIARRFGQDRDARASGAASRGAGRDFGRVPLQSGVVRPIQMKLAVGEPGDRFEQEADRVAEQVTRTDSVDVAHRSPPVIQRLPSGFRTEIAKEHVQRRCAECDEEEPIQRRRAEPGPCSDGSFVPRQIEANLNAVGGGHPLANDQRAYFEPRFGADFSKVRIHADGPADAAARAVDAVAYTRGGDIVFRKGQYSPGTPAGDRLLAHELTHVVQQGAANPLGQGGWARAKAAPRIQRQTSLAPIKLDPPGDCAWPKYLLLKLNVEVAKNIVEELGACEKGEACLLLATKIAAASGEIAARMAINQSCFRGGDEGHNEQIKIKVNMLRTCYQAFTDKRKKCSDTELKTAFFAVQQLALLITAAIATLLTVAAIIAIIVAVFAVVEAITAIAAATAAAASVAALATVLLIVLQAIQFEESPNGISLDPPTKLKT